MARQFVGLDLGTAHTRIWTPEGGVILRSPSAAAIDSESQDRGTRSRCATYAG